MTERHTDVVVLGAGTAGLNAWRAASQAGAEVLVVDPGPLGTTCARVGCMPSKLLIAAAEVAHAASIAPEFGVHAGEVHADPVAVMERVRRLRDRFVRNTLAGGTQALLDRGVLFEAPGQLVGPTTVQAGSTTLHAKAVVIATGSRPWLPPPWREVSPHVITSDDLFELPALPPSVLVVGAGAMGLELGQALGRLGVRVAVLDVVDRLAGVQDPQAQEVARALIGRELELHLSHTLLEARHTDDGVFVRFRDEKGLEHALTWAKVLVATGRRPRLDGLGLEALGLDPATVDPHTGRLGDSAVYLAGDAAGGRMLQHEAAHEGRIAGASAAHHPDPAPQARKAALAIAFTHPQIVTVGLAWDALDPERHAAGTFDLQAQGRAIVHGEAEGRFRVYGERGTGRLVGATLVGRDAEHLGHALAWAVQLGLTVAEVLDMPWYHPVVEEGMEAALKDLARRLRQSKAAK